MGAFCRLLLILTTIQAKHMAEHILETFDETGPSTLAPWSARSR